MSDAVIDTPADAAERDAALDIRESVIVQAPAGSGKTDLLTRRFMKLLAAVDEPEEILAITFTRAATAEMRGRILRDLEVAARGLPFAPGDLPRMTLARAALEHAQRRGWNLLEEPQRLAIETIDSLCLRIAHDRPLLARMGGHLQPAANAAALYTLAARRTLEHLGGEHAQLDQALAHLLDLRDNHLSRCEELLAKMLEVRDQWQPALPLSRAIGEDDWDRARSELEKPFQRENRRAIGNASRLIQAAPLLHNRLLELVQYASANGNDGVGLLAGVDALSPSMPVEHWKSLCDFLLTANGEWRKAVDRRQGFPSEKNNADAKQRKLAMLDLLRWMGHIPHLREALRAIRDLPPARYSQAQWTTLRHILTVLHQAAAELRVVFAERNVVDFTEVALSAIQVLRDEPERVGRMGDHVRHLLIDEFQDTSRRQHELVTALLAAWEANERRTCFLVGDPMQSIYMFRQAEVELFAHVRENGLGPEDNRIRCRALQLSVNFRSHAGLTGPLNSMFEAICAETAPAGSAAVAFARASSSAAAPEHQCVHVHAQVIGSAERHPTRADKREARQREAERVLEILAEQLPLIEQARASGRDYRVAVLVRARPHLAGLVPLLRRNGIPFRAVEIEQLADRQELLDLVSLTRALLHPMDRVAWLSVLRSPWCGLRLADLHRLTGCDDPKFRNLSILDLAERHGHLLSEDGQRRLARTMEILLRALDQRWRQSESPSFAAWIERTWRTLGGAASLNEAAYENAQVFFSLLDQIAPEGLSAFSGELEAEFERLFAQPDPAVSERCGIQLMTIHKAKGLGFDVVIVPGMDRPASTDRHPLLCSLERVSPWHPGETEFLVAPIGEQGEETDPLYKWVEGQRKNRFDEERKRLFYVACTRARRELHLLGTAVASDSGVRPAHRDSLLAAAWPALAAEFEAAARGEPSGVPGGVLAFPAWPGVLEEVAAATDPPSLVLRRLPGGFEPEPAAPNVTASVAILGGQADAPEFRRAQGSLEARAIGSAVHGLLERLGPELAGIDKGRLRARAASLLRSSALTGDSLLSATQTVTTMLLACTADPVCRWILAPHPEAQSEVAWSGFLPSESGPRLRTLRADRVFRAGPDPLAEGADHYWVVDYKTASTPSGALFLQNERALYEPQLLAYARALRALHGPAIRLRLGLYYPAIAAFDYWDPGTV